MQLQKHGRHWWLSPLFQSLRREDRLCNHNGKSAASLFQSPAHDESFATSPHAIVALLVLVLSIAWTRRKLCNHPTRKQPGFIKLLSIAWTRRKLCNMATLKRVIRGRNLFQSPGHDEERWNPMPMTPPGLPCIFQSTVRDEKRWGVVIRLEFGHFPFHFQSPECDSDYYNICAGSYTAGSRHPPFNRPTARLIPAS